jgi:hypothetical protein
MVVASADNWLTGGDPHHPIGSMTATRHPAITKALNFALTETGCNKDQAISMVVATLVEAGIPVRTALNAVVGPGTYQMIADTTWEILQPA